MTKRNYFAKIVAVLMAVLLAFGTFSVTALAAITPNSTGSIKVSGIQTGDENATVSAYRLMTVKVNAQSNQPEDPTYFWVDSVAAYLKGAGAPLSTYINAADNSVAEAFSTATAEEIASFYDIIANEIRNGSLKDSVSAAATITGNGTFTDLEMGNYLVLIDGATRVYRPSAQNVVPTYKDGEWTLEETAIELKSSEPGITKEIVLANGNVKETNASVGDQINYELEATVPEYPEKAANKSFYISDIMPAGLVYDDSTLKVYGVTANGEELLTAGNQYTVGTARPTGTPTDTTFTLNFDYSTIKAYQAIKVTYTATLGAGAVYGDNANTANTNTAYLDYTTTPYGNNNYNTKTDSTDVYTYEMDLVKIKKNDPATTLAGAEFSITRDGSNTALRFVKLDDNGNYRLALDSETGDNVVTTIVSAEGGKLNVIGLGEGKYILTETKAPADYNLPSKPFDFTISASADKAGTAILDGNEDTASVSGVLTKNIENSNGFSLPTTGGMGTVLFTVAGVALVALGVVMIVVLKKKNGKAAE